VITTPQWRLVIRDGQSEGFRRAIPPTAEALAPIVIEASFFWPDQGLIRHISPRRRGCQPGPRVQLGPAMAERRCRAGGDRPQMKGPSGFAPQSARITMPASRPRSRISIWRCRNPAPLAGNNPELEPPAPIAAMQRFRVADRPDAGSQLHGFGLMRQLTALPRMACATPDVVLHRGLGPIWPTGQLLWPARRRPHSCVLIADSRWRECVRGRHLREWSSSLLLRHYSAALVAGQESRAIHRARDSPQQPLFQTVGMWWITPSSRCCNLRPQRGVSAEQAAPNTFSGRAHHPRRRICDGFLAAMPPSQRQGGGWPAPDRTRGRGPQAIAPGRGESLGCPSRSSVGVSPSLHTRYAILPALRPGPQPWFLASRKENTWGLGVNEADGGKGPPFCPVIVSTACSCAADLIHPQRNRLAVLNRSRSRPAHRPLHNRAEAQQPAQP